MFRSLDPLQCHTNQNDNGIEYKTKITLKMTLLQYLFRHFDLYDIEKDLDKTETLRPT